MDQKQDTNDKVSVNSGMLNLDLLLTQRELAYRKSHIFISDKLKEIALLLFPSKKAEIEEAYKLSKLIEMSFWATDNIVDNEYYPKVDRYLDLIVIYESFLRTLEFLLNTKNPLKLIKNLQLLEKIKNKIRELFNLIIYEKQAVLYAREGDLGAAVSTLLEGKSKNAEIYVTIFNHFLKTSTFNDYVWYRKLELLNKDLKDFEEDLKNRNISASTLLYEYVRYGHPFEEARESILKLAKAYLSEINNPLLLKYAEPLLDEIENSINDLEKRISRYAAIDICSL